MRVLHQQQQQQNNIYIYIYIYIKIHFHFISWESYHNCALDYVHIHILKKIRHRACATGVTRVCLSYLFSSCFFFCISNMNTIGLVLSGTQNESKGPPPHTNFPTVATRGVQFWCHVLALFFACFWCMLIPFGTPCSNHFPSFWHYLFGNQIRIVF